MPLMLPNTTPASIDAVPNNTPKTNSIMALSGATIDTTKSRWQLDAETAIDWESFKRLSSMVSHGLRTFITNQITRNSPAYVSNQITWLTYLTKDSVLTSTINSLAKEEYIDRSVYEVFSTEVEKIVSKQHAPGYRAAYIRFYLWCADAELPGFDVDIAADLETIVISGAASGQAVMRQDPNTGPLTEMEYQALQARLRSSAADSLPLRERVTTWLLLCFGCNSKNLRLLLEEDLLRTDLPDGSVSYELRIPRIKKRTAGERDQFRTRHLDPYVGRLVEELIAKQSATSPIDGNVAVRPLIPSRTLRKNLVGTAFERHRHRLAPGEVAEMLWTVANHLDLRTTGGLPLRLTPRRLRYTFATKLVASGASPQEVADALDHSSTAHIMVYFNSRSDVVQRLDKAVGMALAPIAQAFMGKVIRSEAEDDRHGDKASRIRHASPTLNSLETVGSCGSFGFCGLYAPLACYTCASFQAWLDGPHDLVFEQLEAQRNERLSRGADPRMTQIHDRTMLAVAEVMRRCAEQRGAP